MSIAVWRCFWNHHSLSLDHARTAISNPQLLQYLSDMSWKIWWWRDKVLAIWTLHIHGVMVRKPVRRGIYPTVLIWWNWPGGWQSYPSPKSPVCMKWSRNTNQTPWRFLKKTASLSHQPWWHAHAFRRNLRSTDNGPIFTGGAPFDATMGLYWNTLCDGCSAVLIGILK